jgi:hypothetical protein
MTDQHVCHVDFLIDCRMEAIPPAGLAFLFSSAFFGYVMHSMWLMVSSAIRASGGSTHGSNTSRNALVKWLICGAVA